ncbi:hypothetical protein SDC9_210331 [bioreactor metagenome]|uniref:Uncharacterized protein n=1 Tax=bioreactor metagenome TaxID=1076179 RepID=A0A645JH83_9ZZZZ
MTVICQHSITVLPVSKTNEPLIFKLIKKTLTNWSVKNVVCNFLVGEEERQIKNFEAIYEGADRSC